MNRDKARCRGKSRGEMTVGIVCEHATEREALVRAFGAIDGIRAIDCGVGLAESVERVRDLEIGIALLALDPGRIASFAATLRSTDAAIRAVALLRSESEDALARIAQSGVAGFVLQDAGLTSCVRTLRAVRTHGFDCPREIATVVLRGQARRAPSAGRRTEVSDAPLRGRKLEVAECIAAGLSNKQIGDHLRIAEGTVKNHVHSVLTMLGLEHRWEVAAALKVQRSPFPLVRGEAERGEAK